MIKCNQCLSKTFSKDQKVKNCIQPNSKGHLKENNFDHKKETLSFLPQIVIMD
jgi:hypothetical protein